MVADSCGYLEHLPASFSPGRDVVATNENIGQAKNISWTEGLVHLCASRWGTEPEGWYVDLPYAVFLVGVNYSPFGVSLVKRSGFLSIARSERRDGWFDADSIELVKIHLRRGRRRRAIKFEDRFHCPPAPAASG
jgi:hypothetical protein